jgi:hypothetical protein
MDWLRRCYDRVIASASAAFLIVILGFIFFGESSFNTSFEVLRNLPPPNNQIRIGRAAEIADAMQALQSPAQWNSDDRAGLFVPERHFIGTKGEPVTLETSQLHPPVPNDWLDDFDLPITDADVLSQDADGDGFTNFDEWQAQTNPIEKSSHPPYTFKLKLRSVSEEPFPLLFSSCIGDIFAINNLDRKQPTQFLRLGETVKGTRYRLKSYKKKLDTDKYGTRLDLSELVLEQVDNHKVVALVKGKPTTSPESVARFLYTWNGLQQNVAVKKDQEFSLQPQGALTYKLLEVTPEKATIVATTLPDEKIEIGHL